MPLFLKLLNLFLLCCFFLHLFICLSVSVSFLFSFFQCSCLVLVAFMNGLFCTDPQWLNAFNGLQWKAYICLFTHFLLRGEDRMGIGDIKCLKFAIQRKITSEKDKDTHQAYNRLATRWWSQYLPWQFAQWLTLTFKQWSPFPFPLNLSQPIEFEK